MLTNGSRVRALEKRAALTEGAIVVLAESVAAASRSHRRPDMSKPQTVELVELSVFQDLAVRQGLQRLFDQDYFSICDFRALVELARVYPPADLLTHLNPLHCVKWAEMDPEYRTQIQNHIMACFVPVERGTQEGSEG